MDFTEQRRVVENTSHNISRLLITKQPVLASELSPNAAWQLCLKQQRKR